MIAYTPCIFYIFTAYYPLLSFSQIPTSVLGNIFY